MMKEKAEQERLAAERKKREDQEKEMKKLRDKQYWFLIRLREVKEKEIERKVQEQEDERKRRMVKAMLEERERKEQQEKLKIEKQKLEEKIRKEAEARVLLEKRLEKETKLRIETEARYRREAEAREEKLRKEVEQAAIAEEKRREAELKKLKLKQIQDAKLAKEKERKDQEKLEREKKLLKEKKKKQPKREVDEFSSGSQSPYESARHEKKQQFNEDDEMEPSVKQFFQNMSNNSSPKMHVAPSADNRSPPNDQKHQRQQQQRGVDQRRYNQGFGYQQPILKLENYQQPMDNYQPMATNLDNYQQPSKLDYQQPNISRLGVQLQSLDSMYQQQQLHQPDRIGHREPRRHAQMRSPLMQANNPRHYGQESQTNFGIKPQWDNIGGISSNKGFNSVFPMKPVKTAAQMFDEEDDFNPMVVPEQDWRPATLQKAKLAVPPPPPGLNSIYGRQNLDIADTKMMWDPEPVIRPAGPPGMAKPSLLRPGFDQKQQFDQYGAPMFFPNNQQPESTQQHFLQRPGNNNDVYNFR
jgi:hypothetical protein